MQLREFTRADSGVSMVTSPSVLSLYFKNCRYQPQKMNLEVDSVNHPIQRSPRLQANFVAAEQFACCHGHRFQLAVDLSALAINA
jgi:hypothetical protein